MRRIKREGREENEYFEGEEWRVESHFERQGSMEDGNTEERFKGDEIKMSNSKI